VAQEAFRISAGLSIASNAAPEAQSAARSDQMAETAGMLASVNAMQNTQESAVYLDGISVGRAVLNGLRAAEDQSPRIVSD